MREQKYCHTTVAESRRKRHFNLVSGTTQSAAWTAL